MNKGTEVKCVLQNSEESSLMKADSLYGEEWSWVWSTTQIPNYPALKGPEGKEFIKYQ